MKNLLFGCACLGLVLVSMGATNNDSSIGIDDTYTVKSGDTLWSVASMYVEKSTYAKGNIREYIFNITHEWNYELFKNRPSGQLYPGDEIKVKYWVEKDNS